MVDTIGGERIASLTELRRRAKGIIEEIQAATSQQETRVVLTVHGKPVMVLQEYGAYQKMLELLAETQRQLHVAEMGNRLRQRNEPKPTTKRSFN